MMATPGSRLRDRTIDLCVRSCRLLPKGRTTCYHVVHRLLGRPDRVTGTVDGQRFTVDTRDTNIAVNTYLYDVWEPPVAALWVSRLRPGTCVVDVGANKGYYSLLAAPRVLPGGRVISYEPHPRNSADIEATIRANGHPHWIARPTAVSAHEGTGHLFTPGWEEGVSGWGTLEPAKSDGASTIDVPLTTLTADMAALGIDQIDLLKMDIQGHELSALRGAAALLQNGAIRQLFVEIHASILGREQTHALIRLLQGAGYEGFVLLEHALPRSEWCRILRGQRAFQDAELLKPLAAGALQKDPLPNWLNVLWTRRRSTPGGE